MEMDSQTTTPPAIANDLAETLRRLRSDLENVQRELDQALGVWRGALIAEKKEFQSLLQAKQLAWNEQETEWQRQRLAYGQRIEELEAFFKTQLAAREQHAVQALNELDDSWQRDKLLWDQTTARRVKELEEREASWQAENQKQDMRVIELQEKCTHLESAVREASTTSAALEELKEAWQRDKVAWHESLMQRIQEFRQREAIGAEEIQKQDRLIQNLKGELEEQRERVKEFEEMEAASEETSHAWTETTVRSLEHQVTTLDAMMRLLMPDPSHPLRRKTDRAIR